MTLDRRRFLQLTAAGIAAGLTNTACAPDTAENAQAVGKPALLEMLGSDRVRKIGTEYRAAVPNENTAAALRAAIAGSQHKGFPWIGRGSIEEQIQDDFADARTVVVGGWVLSETEARQCALYSLSV